MTLRSEVLPAPFGPMIARISCSRILRLTSFSAWMPPKERLIRSASRMVSPMRRFGARIERLDEALIALGDDPAAHLAGAGQLAVIGVELLVQDEEPADLR